MEFDICGPTRERETKSGNEFDILAQNQNNEPIISFSPDRCRFDRINSRSNSLDISEFVLESPSSLSILNSGDMTNSSDTHSQTLTQPQNSATMSTTAPNTTTNGESPLKQLSSSSSNNSHLQHQQQQRELQRRLEKRIAQASTSSVNTRSGSTSGNCKANLPPSTSSSSNSNSNSTFNHYPRQEYDNQSLGRIASVILNDYAVENSSAVPNPIIKSSTTNSNSMMSSGFDMRKVPTLLPPQRLAIPQKTNTNTSTSSTTTSLISTHNPGTAGAGANTKPRSQEKKPLVQWDSEESEEELSFFPAPKLRSTLTDNLSIDNMSLSGEEDDLHLSPPRSMSNRCPCDPRLLMDSSTSKSRREKHCTII